MRFLDPVIHADFERDGAVRIPGFLDDGQIRQLQALYEELCPSDATLNRMYSNIESLNVAQARELERRMFQICQPSIDRHVADYRVAGASTLVKGLGRESDSKLHQDWNIVDEQAETSMAVWIPLVNVDETNGCLQVLPGSHRWFHTIRSSNIDSIHLSYNFLLNPFLKAIPLKVKDIVVYSINVFHGSKPNRSDTIRPAFVITLVDKQARMIHYVRQQDGSVDAVPITNDFIYGDYFALHAGDHRSYEAVARISGYEKYVISTGAFFSRLYREAVKRLLSPANPG